MPENNLFDIKKRITAAQQTRKITRTMELVASSRLQRGKTWLLAQQEWMQYIEKAGQCLPDLYFKPLVKSRPSGNKAYILFGGAKGLSGAYGPNLLQYAQPIVDGQTLLAVGGVAGVLFPDAQSHFGDEAPSAEFAATIAEKAKALYESKAVDEVHLIYTRSTGHHVAERLFPLVRREEYNGDVITEPSGRLLFPALFGEYAAAMVYGAHLQAFVSEQVARVSAMDSATRNADEIIKDLQAAYNRIRQSSITQEIIAVSNATRGDE